MKRQIYIKYEHTQKDIDNATVNKNQSKKGTTDNLQQS